MNTKITNCAVQMVTADTPQPIERWRKALQVRPNQALEEIRAAYRDHWPTQGELIFTGACEFQCQHCIYPPSYAQLNRGLAVEEWDRILQDMSQKLGIQTFVYGGRSVTANGLEVLARLRERLPEAHIGLIDNGISMLPRRNLLAEVRPDWIDISLDGQEQDHDVQRRSVGSFRAGLEGALWLVRNGVAPKVNILTCLTTLNRNSVIPMIRDLNGMGFKNFFITPVTVVDGVRPLPQLRLPAEEFAVFIAELRAALGQLDDAWVEVNLFSVTYAEYVARFLPDIWSQFVSDRDSLSWYERSPDSEERGASEFFIRYYPSSLTGTREFIVNTNGDVIVPTSMVAGRIEEKHVLGNLLRQAAVGVVEGLPDSAKFSFYEQEFLHEQDMLRRYV